MIKGEGGEKFTKQCVNQHYMVDIYVLRYSIPNGMCLSEPIE